MGESFSAMGYLDIYDIMHRPNTMINCNVSLLLGFPDFEFCLWFTGRVRPNDFAGLLWPMGQMSPIHVSDGWKVTIKMTKCWKKWVAPQVSLGLSILIIHSTSETNPAKAIYAGTQHRWRYLLPRAHNADLYFSIKVLLII